MVITELKSVCLAEMRTEHLARQIEHWRQACQRLADLDMLASPQAWQSLEHYVGIALRESLSKAVERLRADAEALAAQLARPQSGSFVRLRSRAESLRQAFLRTETTLDFFADALATRANPRTASLLQACDHIATRSMAEALVPLGRQVPAALTYLDKGLGASILRAGIRLWDGATDNPVAAIKVVRLNLVRPSSAIHECGHQVSHLLGWNRELAEALHEASSGVSQEVQDLWVSWTTEIAADAFAFVHVGYAAIATLHDVLDGETSSVFQYLPGDPHPISDLRVFLGTAMCRRSYGAGPWDHLEAVWRASHPLDQAPSDVRAWIIDSLPILPHIVETILYRPYRAFAGQPLTHLINPQRVSPQVLAQLERDAKAAAFTSSYWVWNEAIRLLALTGYKAGLRAQEAARALQDQEQLMQRLGQLRLAA